MNWIKWMPHYKEKQNTIETWPNKLEKEKMKSIPSPVENIPATPPQPKKEKLTKPLELIQINEPAILTAFDSISDTFIFYDNQLCFSNMDGQVFDIDGYELDIEEGTEIQEVNVKIIYEFRHNNSN